MPEEKPEAFDGGAISGGGRADVQPWVLGLGHEKASRADKRPHLEGLAGKHINCLVVSRVTVR